ASAMWNNPSAMRRKCGRGVSEKRATDPTEFRANWTSPASPPRTSHAPSRLSTRNETATGRPRNSSTVEPPSISHAAASHDMALAGRDRVVARRALGECQATHAEQHLDGQREESDRQHAEQPPLRRHQRLDGHRARLEAGDRGADAVVADHQAAGGESESLEEFAVSRLEPVHDYFASTCCSCRPYCGLALMAFAQPISLAFSTYALAVAASKAITWMPASAWRFASPWL